MTNRTLNDTDRKPFKRPELSTIISEIALCLSFYSLHMNGLGESVPQGPFLVLLVFWLTVALTIVTTVQFIYGLWLHRRGE